MSLYGVLFGVIAWGASIGGAFLYGQHVSEDHTTATIARENHIAQVTQDAAQRGAAAAIAANKPKNITIRQEIEREIRERTVYADCRHSPEQLRRLNAAITGDEPEPAGSGLVPKAGPLVGRQLRSDDEQAGGGGDAVP